MNRLACRATFIRLLVVRLNTEPSSSAMGLVIGVFVGCLPIIQRID